ncbi:MAG TPA: nicotinate-nucleotide adenylyltransferase [Gemmatimonadota bacterium]|jgi:nicotinate-nucleotide adenylyltransferase|nr:nicotinate-nucleotide adenylyltransferase [Gemmatimonadota bacterium]
MRKGILGGTFNPPHIAHLIVAQEVRETMDLDQVVLVPTSIHAFKGPASAVPRHRAAMTELAVAGDPRLAVDRIEIQRGGVSYTVDTLRALREREPETDWTLILGRDNLDELREWREADALPDLADIVVTTRAGLSAPERLPFGGRCALVDVPSLEVSSTDIRQRVASGRSIRYWVPPAVEAYIREHDLYREAVPAGSIDKAPPRG